MQSARLSLVKFTQFILLFVVFVAAYSLLALHVYMNITALYSVSWKLGWLVGDSKILWVTSSASLLTLPNRYVR